MNLSKPKLKVGDKFQAIIRTGARSKTLGGEEGAGRLAWDGKIFTAISVKPTSVETENFDFEFCQFQIRVVA